MFGLLNIKNTKAIFKEISNFLFIQSVIEKNVDTEEWKSFSLRHDLANRIYTVISLREEDMGEMEDMKKLKVLDRMRPINEYITSLGLQEIVMPSIEEIPDTRSYLVVYVPIFNRLSISWALINLIFPVTLLFAIL